MAGQIPASTQNPQTGEFVLRKAELTSSPRHADARYFQPKEEQAALATLAARARHERTAHSVAGKRRSPEQIPGFPREKLFGAR